MRGAEESECRCALRFRSRSLTVQVLLELEASSRKMKPCKAFRCPSLRRTGRYATATDATAGRLACVRTVHEGRIVQTEESP